MHVQELAIVIQPEHSPVTTICQCCWLVWLAAVGGACTFDLCGCSAKTVSKSDPGLSKQYGFPLHTTKPYGRDGQGKTIQISNSRGVIGYTQGSH